MDRLGREIRRAIEAKEQYDPASSADDLARDIQLATDSHVAILISGAPERTLAVARLIAGGGGHHSGLETRDIAPQGEFFVLITSTNRFYRGSTMLIPEVQTLSGDEQAALTDQLPRAVRHLRVIATTSVDLFERVTLGTFNGRLFYRLNTIHITLPFQALPTT